MSCRCRRSGRGAGLLAALLFVGLARLASADDAIAETNKADASAKRAEDVLVLKAFSAPVPLDGGPLWVTILTDRSVEALWRNAPAQQALRSEAARGGTVMYVMGIATRGLVVPTSHALIQKGATIAGTVVNVANFNGQQVPEGSVVLGLIEFERKVDFKQPFTLRFGDLEVDFRLDPRDVDRWGGLQPPTQTFAK
jgi:hypothetical protein